MRNEPVKISNNVRRHNSSGKHGTINQDVAKSAPRWASDGSGALINLKSKDCIIRGSRNKWTSLSKHAPKQAPSVSFPSVQKEEVKYSEL